MTYLAIGEAVLSDIGLALSMVVAFGGCIGIGLFVKRHLPRVDLPAERAETPGSTSPPRAA